jgi:hypothetical protein
LCRGNNFGGLLAGRNVHRCRKVSKDELAAIARNNMLFPKREFIRAKRPIVICRQDFGIGAGHSNGCVGIAASWSNITEMARQRFFKGSVAVVKRHGYLLS